MSDYPQVCILFDLYTPLLDDFIDILKELYGLDLYPLFFSKVKHFKAIDWCYSIYRDTIKQTIKSSEVIVAIVNNTFLSSKETKQLLKFAKDAKKPVIALLVENIDEDKRSTLLNGTSYCFDIYKERFSETGYDRYLWVSYTFNDFIEKLNDCLKTKFTLPRVSKRCNTIYIFNTILKKDDIQPINAFFERFSKVMPIKEVESNKFDLFNYTNDCMEGIERAYLDLNKNKINKRLNRKYAPSPRYDKLDMMLEKANIYNKNDYLSLLQYLDEVIDTKLEEFHNDRVRGKAKGLPGMQLSNIRNRIKFRVVLAYHGTEYYSDDSDCETDSEEKYVKRSAYKCVEQNFEKLSISLDDVNEIAGFIQSLKVDERETLKMLASNVIVISLFKDFYKTEKFEKILRNLTSLKKTIFIAKMEDFEINEKKLEETLGRLFRGVYDLYKHKDHQYDGIELKKLFRDIKAEGIPLKLDNLIYQTYYDVFIADDGINTASKDYVLRFGKMLKAKNFDVHMKKDFDSTKKADAVEIMDAIEKSRSVVFFLTNEYMNSEQFKNEYTLIRKLDKPHMMVLMEEIHTSSSCSVDMNQFRVIHMYKAFDANSCVQSELSYRLSYLVCLMLKYCTLVKFNSNSIDWCKKEEGNFEFDPYMTPLPAFHVLEHDQSSSVVQELVWKRDDVSTKFTNVDLCVEFIENNHILIFDHEWLRVYERNSTMSLVRNIPRRKSTPRFRDACFVKCLNQLYLLAGDSVWVYDRSYAFQKQIKFKNTIDTREHIAYNDVNQTIYLHTASNLTNVRDVHLRTQQKTVNCVATSKKVVSMKIYKDRVYYLFDDCVHVFNTELQFLAEFGKSLIFHASSLIFSPGGRLSDFIVVATKLCLFLFSLNGPSYVSYGGVNLSDMSIEQYASMRDTNRGINNCFIVNDYLINIKRGIKVLKIIFVDRLSEFFKCNYLKVVDGDESCLCKMDPYRPHLLVNVHELPCGQFAGCLECIYKKMSLNSTVFACLCKSEHSLSAVELKKLDVIERKTKTICQNMVNFAREIVNTNCFKSEKSDFFEKYFDIVENDLDIRVESIKASLDLLQNESDNKLRKIEKIFLKKSKMNAYATTATVAALTPVAKQQSKNNIQFENLFNNFPFTSFYKNIQRDHMVGSLGVLFVGYGIE